MYRINDQGGPRWPLSAARQQRKLRVLLFGRQRRRSTVSDPAVCLWKPTREPKYTRVSSRDRERIRKWAYRGLSQRAIARRLRPRRDHRTVGYWLARLPAFVPSRPT